LKKEFLLAERKRDPNTPPFNIGPQQGERVGLRVTVIDALTGKAGQPVEVKDPNLVLLPHPLSPDGKSLLALDITNRNALRLLDAGSGKERVRLSSLLRPINAVTFSPDGRYFAAASARGQNDLAAPSEVVIWDAASGKELARLTDKDTIHDYTALRFSPDG